jgi:hypothetical protein
MKNLQILLWIIVFTPTLALQADPEETDYPRPDERQLPTRMHSAMKDLPVVKVGQADADILGHDNRALQAAVDYVAGLGGGIVEIGPGDYLMRDSLHLRPFVTVRGAGGKTVLRKADGVVSSLAIDGDFGEEQITVKDPKGFEVGCGVAIWSSKENYFHATVARITGRTATLSSTAREMPIAWSPTMPYATAFLSSAATTCRESASNTVHRGKQGHNIHLDAARRRHLPVSRLRHGNRPLPGPELQRRRHQLPAIQRCHRHRLRQREQRLAGPHPGSGSQRPIENAYPNNGGDGLFLCWRFDTAPSRTISEHRRLRHFHRPQGHR